MNQFSLSFMQMDMAMMNGMCGMCVLSSWEKLVNESHLYSV